MLFVDEFVLLSKFLIHLSKFINFWSFLYILIGKKILTKWEVTSTGYRKVNEAYLTKDYANSIIFSGDGKFFLMWLNDNRTHWIFNSGTLECTMSKELTGKDSNNNDITYFYDSKLSHDGSYIIGGDSYNRMVFDNKGEFVKRIDGRNMYTIYMYSKTEFVGTKNADEAYTKTNLVAIDFLKDTETVLYQFDSYISTFHINPEATLLVYEKYPNVRFLLIV